MSSQVVPLNYGFHAHRTQSPKGTVIFQKSNGKIKTLYQLKIRKKTKRYKKIKKIKIQSRKKTIKLKIVIKETVEFAVHSN